MKIALLIPFIGLVVSTGAFGQAAVPLNFPTQNTTAKTKIVIASCNATAGAKDLEGWVGQTSASTIVASLSGVDRQSITIVVPPTWFFKISVVIPPSGTCSATSWIP